MRYVVNGLEAELPSSDCSIADLGDRLGVRTAQGHASALAVRQGDAVLVSFRGRVFKVERPGRTGAKGHGGGEAHVRAPMPGTLTELLVAVGDTVSAGDRIAVLEAMKTLQPLLANQDGTVSERAVEPGEQVSEGQIIVRIEASGATE